MNPEEIAKRPKAVVFVVLENSGNGLTQNEWAFCVASVRAAIHLYAWTCDEWFTEPSSVRQSACWGFQVFTDDGGDLKLKQELAREARAWQQESIEWIQAAKVEQIKPC